MFGVKDINLSFFLDLFFKGKIFPKFYSKISNNLLFCNHENEDISNSKNIYSIFDIPNYYNLIISKTHNNLKTLKAPLYYGFLINLSKYESLEDYLTNKLGRGRKSQLKRYRIRLDLCISPIYKIYFGEISKKEYDGIFEHLKRLTIKRFEEKKELNYELPYLEVYQKMMYALVLEKKANIFVIYDKQKPINITLNFIENQTLFHWNSCYDIDYQVFNLGHINMVNHLEWSFNNNIKVFDMGRGDFLHKRKYITSNYTYEEHIIYNNNNFITALFAHYKFYKLKLRFALIQRLKKINAQVLYSKYAKFKYKIFRHKTVKPQHEKNTDITIIDNIPDSSKLNLIDLTQINPAIVKTLNYFLHRSKESINMLEIFKDDEVLGTFYISGKKKKAKITISNTSNK